MKILQTLLEQWMSESSDTRMKLAVVEAVYGGQPKFDLGALQVPACWRRTSKRGR